MAGTVYKRGDTWWYSFYYKGKKYRQSSKSTRKRDAEQLLVSYLNQVAKGEFQGFEDSKKSLSLSDALALAIDDAEMRGLRNVYHTRFRSDRLKAFFKEAPVESITEQAIARYVAARRKDGMAHSTINRELAVLRSALKMAKKHKAIKELPDIPRFREENVRMRFFDNDDFNRIAENLPDVLRDMALFAYHTGWRKGQILSLQWKDVHRDVIRLTGETVKTKSVQVLALAGHVGEIIERRRLVQNGPWVFHRNGRQIRDFRDAWRSALRAAGVVGYTFHDFRRTATRNMALAGVPEKHIMQVTGHKTTAMLNRYNITVEQDTYDTLIRTQEFLKRAQSSHIGEKEEMQEKTESNTND